MNEQSDAGLDGPEAAADRVAEIDRLSREIRTRLEEMTAGLDEGSASNVKAITNKLDLLHAAHLKVLAAEDAFHAKLGTDPDADAIDYDAIRVDVGCRLDRLRESLMAEGFPCDADTRAACHLALSVRLLGDAASDRPKR